MSTDKQRVIKDYEKLDLEIQEQIKLMYPNGFSQFLISFTNKEGKLVSALPLETDDRYYLVRMTAKEAKQIVDEDEDYDDDGNLKDESREEFVDKYSDLEYIADNMDDDDFDID
jgi:DNA-directed RNA polymerase subunit K/omega